MPRSLPRFEDETSFTLNDALMALGMTDAFDEVWADLTGMESSGDLFTPD